MDCFIVDFEIRTSKEILAFRGLTDERKYVTHCARNNTRFRIVTAQGKGFPRGCLPVCKDNGVVAFHSSVDVRTRDGAVYWFVRRTSED